MRPEASNRSPCRTSGVILTCYVDGHKRFRSVPLAEEARGGDFEVLDNNGGENALDAARFNTSLRRNRQVN